MIDLLSEKTRKGLNEQAAEIETARQRVATVTTTNLEAYQHYFKGEELLGKIKIEEAITEFRKAIALDSTFGLAHYRLGYALHLVAGRNLEAKASLQTAMSLLEHIPERDFQVNGVASPELANGRNDHSIHIGAPADFPPPSLHRCGQFHVSPSA